MVRHLLTKQWSNGKFNTSVRWGTVMLFSRMERGKKLLMITVLLLTGACKQDDFYQKENLSEIGDETVGLPIGGVDGTPLDPELQPPAGGGSGTETVKLADTSESFTQKNTKNGDVDILWVIDDSGSMADNQKRLAENFQSFIDHFLTKNTNFKMAITSTDGTANKNGRMIGDSNLLTSTAAKNNKAKFLSDFQKLVKVGTKGSGIEQGLKCSKSFFDRYAASFLREDAYLAIVILSDEEDQSESTLTEYVNHLKSLKRNAGMVKVYSIVTQKILPNQKWESIGKRYNYVAEQTAGIKGDLDSDFHLTLSDMGSTIVQLIEQFPLGKKPYKNKIQVYVNGVLKTSGWVYDSDSQSVKFSTGNVPSNGALVEIKYQVEVK